MPKLLNMFFVMVTFLLLVGSTLAESVDTAWVRIYNGPGNNEDYPAAMAVDGAGNVYVTGYSEGNGTSHDYATIKYYSNGDTAWVRRYNGPGNLWDEVKAMVVDDSGHVYVTGGSYGIGTSYDYVTIKYFSNGDIAWVERYDGPGNSEDMAFAITVDDSNCVYVTGTSKGIGTQTDYCTIKYHPNGDTVWVRRYNGPGNLYDNASALTVNDSGYIYVTGNSDGIETQTDYCTIKYYPNGDTVWVRRYNGPGNSHDYTSAIAINGSGNVYVCGYSYSHETKNDYAVVKYYQNGDTAWVRRYNGPGNNDDAALAMAVDIVGNVYVTGVIYDSGTFDDYATMKYNSVGDSLWARIYVGPGNWWDMAKAIKVDDSGNVYVTGYSYGGSGTDYDFATIKYFPNGDTAWVRRYNGPANNSDQAFAIVVDDSSNVYVTGTSQGDLTSMDYATIKYVKKPSDVGNDTQISQKPFEFSLSQNYPNPFNPSTTIKFKIQSSRFKVPIPTTLKIYDVLGEKVRTLVDEPKLAGDYSVAWDGKNDNGEQLASGVYFYQLIVGGYTSAKKMVLLK